jgi:hypothetical protein
MRTVLLNREYTTRIDPSQSERAAWSEMKRRKLEFTVEHYQKLTVNRTDSRNVSWCPFCGEQVPMLTVDQTATLLGCSSQEIDHQVEAGLVHIKDGQNGVLQLCLKSMMRSRGT